MRRREFITALGGAAASALPFTARALQPIPVIGYLHSASPKPFARHIAAFWDGLKDSGFVEGRHVTVEYRWADGQFSRLPELAADLVRRKMAVIVAMGGVLPVRAAKAATTTLPIVFAVGGDPVRAGIVTSLNRPIENLTGYPFLNKSLEAKRVGLLRELVPKASSIAALINPENPASEGELKEVREATTLLGVRPIVLKANPERDFEPSFAALVREKADALLVTASPYFNDRRDQIVALAARYRVPAIYEFREFVEAGGLASYGTNLADGYRQVGAYAARILKGAKPADLPVVQSTKFEFLINLKVAKTLGLEIAPMLLARADAVIE